VTNDANMLALPREMTVLAQTRLTLVVIRGDGDSAVRATGALLCHLPFICRHTTPERAQVWRLGTAQKNYDDVTVYLDQIAAKQGRRRGAVRKVQAFTRRTFRGMKHRRRFATTASSAKIEIATKRPSEGVPRAEYIVISQAEARGTRARARL
jgi:hypothetical protein